MSSPASFDEAAEAHRKAEKKARKAEKKRRREEEAEAENATAPAAAAEESPSGSPVAPSELEEDAERQARKRRKQEKKERKAREAAGDDVAMVEAEPSRSPSPSPSPVMGERSSTFSASPMTALRKNFYKQHPEVAAMSRQAVDAIRAEYKMTLTGEMYGKDALYHPVTAFHQCGYSKELLKCTEGFKAPTGIQAQAWPVLLMGRDAIAIAETGSGKTLGFVLPALVHILDAKPIDTSKKGGKGGVENMGPVALILAPTRELAMQSAEVAESAAKNVGLTVACVYGGVERYVQRQAIAKGVHIMVACPGRLLSFVKDGEISLNRVSFLVLDEADRMLDMGFEPDIRAIIGFCPDSQRRQTLMFSATWPESVKALAAAFIVDPLRITIGKDESELNQDTLAANKRIKQTVEVMDEWKRDARLIEIMQQATKGAKEHKKIIVFVLYKKEVDRVERTLRAKGFNAVGMSSDKSQAERTAAIENFKNGKVRLLVATDVAGRGLDINDIALVLNYSFPLTVEDYVHRIGRTGRGGKSGESITFFTKNEKHLSGELINVLREANQEVPEALMKFGTGVKKKEHGLYGAFFKPQDDDKPMKKATKVTFD